MILVVGGTGTLGREIVRRLLDAGSRVRVLTRERTRVRTLPEAVEIAIGDLRAPSSILEAVRGCSAVVSAAHGFQGPDNPGPEAIDHVGNRTLIGASAQAGVSHFVLVSVHGASPDHPMSLVRAKHAAEAYLRASGLPFTIVRSTPFMETWLNIMRGMFEARGRVTVFGHGINPVNFVSASDVAAAVALAVAAASPANETLEITGPDNIGLAALARQIIQARGEATPIEHVPLAALRALSILARPFAPSFARQAQAAVLMNTTDMAVAGGPASDARRPGIPTTSFGEVLARAGA